MTALMAPAGLVPLSAPLPIPRRYTLLDVALTVTAENDRWLAGVSAEGFIPGPASVHDPCSTGTARIKDAANAIALPRFGAFTVYLVGQCTSVSIGPDATDWTDRLQLAFQAVEADAVERVFATGEGSADFGPYLTDANLKVLDGSGVNIVEGIALLEAEIAARGGGGIIHVTPYLATLMAAARLLETERGQKITAGNGTRVAIGAGYTGAAASTAPGEEWAYASGPVAYTRGDVMVVPADYAQALDRSNNDVLFIAEREYVLNWVGRTDPSDETHTQAGVLIDRIT